MQWTTLTSQQVVSVILVFLLGLMTYRHYLKNKYLKNHILDIGEDSAIGTRERQEDVGGVVERDWGTLTVLADGMGKGQYGKIAALTTVRVFMELFTKNDITNNIAYFFTQAFNQSNKEVLERLQGTKGKVVATALLMSKGHLYYASVGDIKIAVLRNQEMIPINEGHTMKTAAVKGFAAGVLSRQEALAISKIHRQMNYVGRDGFRNIEISQEPVKVNTGDTIIVMNDGIYKNISWIEMESILAKPEPCQQLAEQLIEVFNRKTVPDKGNASLFVLRYNGV